MLRLNKPMSEPPGGWKDEDPDTKVWFKTYTFASLVEIMAKHRRENGLSVPSNFADVIIDRICSRMPAGVCSDSAAVIQLPIQPASGTSQIINKTYGISNKMRISNRVPVRGPVPIARAKTCVSCEFCKPHAGCATCKGLKTAIDSVVKSLEYVKDAEGKVCAATGLLLQFAVCMDQQSVAELIKREGMGILPPSCWMTVG